MKHLFAGGGLPGRLVPLLLLVAVGLPAQKVALRNQIGMEFVLIPAGTFLMGAPAQTNFTQPDEFPARQVTLTRPFLLGLTEVTQAQWLAVMGYNHSHFKDERNLKANRRFLNHPAENVSWEDAQEFLRRLNLLEGRKVYRLPTEAEWEYAYRAAGKTPESLGDSLELAKQCGWFDQNARQVTHPVAKKRVNGFGLYDMDGNVCEWVQDWYAETNPPGPLVDPQGPVTGLSRAFRGSSWNSVPQYLRASQRYCLPPNYQLGILGFRVCREVDPEPVTAGQ